MSIEELKDKRTKLEHDINDLLIEFRRDTGLTISDFDKKEYAQSDLVPPFYSFSPVLKLS